MKLILYHTDNRVLEVVENIQSPSVEGSNVYWEGGSVHGTDLFLLLDDHEEVEDLVTDDLILLDQRENFLKPSLMDENEELRLRLAAAEKENNQLARRMEETENAVLTLMDLTLL